MELNGSGNNTNSDEDLPCFEGRGGLRVFWSLYTAVLEFFTCNAVAQFCCGQDQSTSAM